MSNQSPEILACLQSINRFLEDFYAHPRLLSDILRDAGVGEDDIDQLRRDHLDAYLAGLLRRWRTWMVEILPSRRDDIPSTGSGHRIVRRYGLNGRPRSSLADPSGRAPGRSLSNEYGIRVSVSANWGKML